MQVTIQGYGVFEIPNEKAEELVQWLQRNSVKLQEGATPSNFDGTQLITG